MRHLSLSTLLVLSACTAQVAPGEVEPGFTDDGKGDSSAIAAFRNFTFDGEIITRSDSFVRESIDSQLLYTVGQLNGESSLARLDTAVIENQVTTRRDDGAYLTTYRATLHVAWGDRDHVPASYTMILPRDATALGAFTTRYLGSCASSGAHDVDENSFWYYYRPARSGCQLADADVVRAPVTIADSPIASTGKYPEYHKVWEDSVLRVVAVFGKDEASSLSASDLGVRSYRNYVSSILELLGSSATTEPAQIPTEITTAEQVIVIRADLGDGRTVEVNALLVPAVRQGSRDFYDRYNRLSSSADFISYSGHSDLGANIRALANYGTFVTGQYVIVMMDGCDTYAYVDSALADAHRAVNEDDTNGTKYLDLVMNAMPSPFYVVEEAPVSIVRGLLNVAEPKTYETMFEGVTRSQVVLVSGEQDNAFTRETPLGPWR